MILHHQNKSNAESFNTSDRNDQLHDFKRFISKKEPELVRTLLKLFYSNLFLIKSFDYLEDLTTFFQQYCVFNLAL